MSGSLARTHRGGPVRSLPVVLTGACVGVLACAVLAGCSATEPAPPRPPAPDLVASITQFRHDEGTRNLRAGVTNAGRDTVTVTAAALDWPGFARTAVAIEDGTLAPGRTAGFTLRHGDPRCDREPTRRPLLVVRADGVQRRLPLQVEDPRLLERLHQRECRARRLAATASVRLRLAGATTVRGGETYLPGEVVVARRPGAEEEVTVADLGGSVLLHLLPRDGAGALPAHLGPGRHLLRVPVLVGSAHRCDPHALANSSQTFLLSVAVRLGQDPVQRVITVPDAPGRARLNAIIRGDCR